MDKKKEWEENRFRTYCSSFRHFIRAICSNKTLSQDSIFINAVKIDSTQYEYNFDYDPKMYLSKHGFKVYQLQDLPWESVFSKPLLNVVNVNTLLSQNKTRNEYSLSTDFYLQVVYTKESDNLKVTEKTIFNPKREQISWLYLIADTVSLDKYGRYWDEFKIQTYGYFSYQRIADLLPFDYFPPDSTIFLIKSFNNSSLRKSSPLPQQINKQWSSY